jgi:hypothetical protein
MYDISVRIEERRVVYSPLNNRGHDFLDTQLGRNWDYGPREGPIEVIRLAHVSGLSINVRYQ